MLLFNVLVAKHENNIKQLVSMRCKTIFDPSCYSLYTTCHNLLVEIWTTSSTWQMFLYFEGLNISSNSIYMQTIESLLWRIVIVGNRYCGQSLLWRIVMWRIVIVANRYCGESLLRRIVIAANRYVANRYCGESLLWRIVIVANRYCGESRLYQAMHRTDKTYQSFTWMFNKVLSLRPLDNKTGLCVLFVR